jgi:putative heme iron utilization protein
MRTLKNLIQGQPVAALGTLHAGQPFVSMVPFAVLPDGSAMVIHVSHLATHTKDMLESPDVSLMVTAPLTPEVAPQELPRVTVQGRAVPCDASSPGYTDAKAVYVERFPQSAGMFDFADFQLFLIQPTSARYVGGFARATTLTSDALADSLRREQ